MLRPVDGKIPVALQIIRQKPNAADMLFVLNATSLQLIPTTVIALRASFSSAAPADIILPTLIATVCSTALGALLVVITSKRRKRKAR